MRAIVTSIHIDLLTVHGEVSRVRSGLEVPPLLSNHRAGDPPFLQPTAEVAELVDALASGVSEHLLVEVQVLFSAPPDKKKTRPKGGFFFKVIRQTVKRSPGKLLLTDSSSSG